MEENEKFYFSQKTAVETKPQYQQKRKRRVSAREKTAKGVIFTTKRGDESYKMRLTTAVLYVANAKPVNCL